MSHQNCTQIQTGPVLLTPFAHAFFGCREQKPHAVTVTGGTEVPQQLLLLLLLQLTEELTSQRSAPQGEEEGPGDPLGGVLGMHQVTVVALCPAAMHYWEWCCLGIIGLVSILLYHKPLQK